VSAARARELPAQPSFGATQARFRSTLPLGAQVPNDDALDADRVHQVDHEVGPIL
jgi:hypothetical protein